MVHSSTLIERGIQACKIYDAIFKITKLVLVSGITQTLLSLTIFLEYAYEKSTRR